jgi:nucleotide-binding universal stress UspA family protein
MLGSVAERVVRLAACPVMTVKSVMQPPSDT